MCFCVCIAACARRIPNWPMLLYTFWFISCTSFPTPFLYTFRLYLTEERTALDLFPAVFTAASVHLLHISLSGSFYLSSLIYLPLYHHAFLISTTTLYSTEVVSHCWGRAIYRLLVIGWKGGGEKHRGERGKERQIEGEGSLQKELMHSGAASPAASASISSQMSKDDVWLCSSDHSLCLKLFKDKKTHSSHIDYYILSL